MTRRTPAPRVGESGRRASRMAPGGRLYSETTLTSYNPGPGSDGSGGGALRGAQSVTISERIVDDTVAPGPYSTLAPLPEPEQ